MIRDIQNRSKQVKEVQVKLGKDLISKNVTTFFNLLKGQVEFQPDDLSLDLCMKPTKTENGPRLPE